MSLAQVIHQTWAAADELTARIPAARFFTGSVPPDTPLPYAQLLPVAVTPVEYTSSRNYLARERLRISIWAQGLAEALAIRTVVDDLFHALPERNRLQAHVTLFHALPPGSSSPLVLSIEQVAGQQQEQPEQVWRVDLEYEFLLQRQHA